jgi:hypothetical protein
MNVQEFMLRGSFSYFNDNTLVFQIDDVTQGRITRIDATVARLYFMSRDATGNYVPSQVPGNLTLRETSTGILTPVLFDSFFIAWTSSYELKDGAAIVLSLDVQRQQAIRTRLDTSILE